MSTPISPIRSSLPALFFTDEMPPRPYPSIFMYAIAGAGKTNALATLKDLNPLIFATEIGNTKGMSTLGHLHMAAVLINTLDELIIATGELASRSKPGQLYYGGQGPFGCIAVDSLTGIGPMLENAAKKLKSWDMIWDATPGGGKDPRSAYPYIAEKGRQVVEKMMNLPAPLILTCREQIVTEGEGANAKSYPAPELPGQKLPRELPGWPEATIRLRTINGQRRFITQTEGDVTARVRLREGLRLPKECLPDLGALLRLLQGDETALPLLIPPKPKTAQEIAEENRARQAVKK